MEPRKLSVLRIDDSPEVGEPQAPTAPSPERPIADNPHLRVCSFESEGHNNGIIEHWADALHFWEKFEPERDIPDLVLADVLFEEDHKSPLNEAYENTKIPTGLSHLKPFAAITRAREIPLGIGLHTANPEVWKEAEDRMERLAAHEVGEVASMLDQDSSLSELPLEGKLEASQKWLKGQTKSQVGPALSVALEDYRERLVRLADNDDDLAASLRVLPEQWMELQSWCTKMKEKREDCPESLEEAGPGLSLTRRDGTQDCVSVESLFAEVMDIQRGNPLDGKCFDLDRPTDSPWRLDEDGDPQIGALVRALGSLARVYDDACNVLGHFPVTLNSEMKIEERLGDVTEKDRVRGLAVLFQILRREKRNFYRWKELFRRRKWYPEQLKFGSSVQEENSLRSYLSELQNLARGETGWFELGSVFHDKVWKGLKIGYGNDADVRPDAGWIRWHFEMLVESGVLESKNEKYRVRQGVGFSVPPVPVSTEGELPDGLDLVGESGVKKYLRQSLGYSDEYGPKGDDWNALGRFVSGAFALDGEKAGKDFIDRFQEGEAPAWLKELSKQYLEEEIDWNNSEAWPEYLS